MNKKSCNTETTIRRKNDRKLFPLFFHKWGTWEGEGREDLMSYLHLVRSNLKMSRISVMGGMVGERNYKAFPVK